MIHGGAWEAADVSAVGEDLRVGFVGDRVNSHLGTLLFELGVPVVFDFIVCPS